MKKQKVFRMIGKIFTFGFFGFSLMLPAGIALAANDYVPLTTIPGAFTENQTVNPVDVVKNIYGVSIGIAALLAVGMIIWAGVEYATTEAIEGKSNAKGKWQGALAGLIILLGAYILLRTINVQLVNINLESLTANPLPCKVDLNPNVPCAVKSGQVNAIYQQSLSTANASVASYQQALTDLSNSQKAVLDAQKALDAAKASGDQKAIATAQAALDNANKDLITKTTTADVKRVDSAIDQGNFLVQKALTATADTGVLTTQAEADQQKIAAATAAAQDALKIQQAAAAKITDPAAAKQAQAAIALNTEMARVTIGSANILNGLDNGSYPTVGGQGAQAFQSIRASYLSQTANAYATLKQTNPAGAEQYRQSVLTQLKAMDDKWLSNLQKCPNGYTVQGGCN